MALCLDAQPLVSTTNPILRSLARRVHLAESEPKATVPVALGQAMKLRIWIVGIAAGFFVGWPDCASAPSLRLTKSIPHYPTGRVYREDLSENPSQNGMTRAVTQIASLDWRPPDGEVDEFLPYLSAAHFSYRQLKTKTGSRARQYSLGQYSLGQCSLERPFRNFVPCFSQGSFLIRRSPRLVLSLRTQ